MPLAAPVLLEDQYLSQIPQRIPSSPYRIRGAIWQKPGKPEAPLVSAPGTTVHSQEQSEEIDNFDEDDEAFEALQALESIGVETNHARLETPIDFRSHMSKSVSGPPTMENTKEYNFEDELADLPSDAFASSSSPEKSPTRRENDAILISSQPEVTTTRKPNLAAPQQGLRQMTLFGDAAQGISSVSQAAKRHNWPVANKSEPPTHHVLNSDALKTWIYPTNLGTIREYQFNIVARGLYHNLLVALPTGLGKTFIAATVMLNWYRWTKDAQIVFVAPTKPLVSQQVEACFGIAGIPRSQTTMLTGGISPGLRAEEWASKRVFFMTPQTIINDLKTGICDPKKIVLLVVDEAHRATGAYAYVEVVKFIRRFNQSFRVLALTATPGASVETVQEVIDGLDISRVEIRTEFSLDIRQYVHSRKTETVVFDNSEEMELVMDLFSQALQPVLNKLNQFNAYWSKDPMQLSAYGLTQARQRWMLSSAGKNANMGVKGMVNRIFSVLASLAHSIELLKFHGIGPFYHGMISFRNGQEAAKGGKYEKEILDSSPFQKMMTRLQFWINNPRFIGHPKLDYLQGVVLKHFVSAGDDGGVTAGAPPSATRIMIFAHYRDSAEEIVRTLKRNEPMIRPHVFVGQAASKGSEGMDQKKQLEIIQDFKNGKYNTLVATSIGEEGLDIGEVDLIICYDSSASPIRMLQRMGRTGRKRAGNIVLLLMRGKEENSFAAAKDNYEKMQQMIAAGTRFNFHDDRSPRIVPRDVVPVVDKRVVDIPIENTQAELPEPKKRAGRAPKRPPKKFHMPDGVRTGFVKASRIDESEDDDDGTEAAIPQALGKGQRVRAEVLEPIPALENVLLNEKEERELETKYQNVPEGHDGAIAPPRLSQYPAQQRKLGSLRYVRHGHATDRTVKMLRNMHSISDSRIALFERASTLSTVGQDEAIARIVASDEDDELMELPPPKVKAKRVSKPKSTTTVPKRPRKPRAAPKAKAKARAPMAFDAVDEALGSSPPPTSPRMLMPSQGISLGSDTSGEDEDEVPDSELQDFIVEDDEEIEQTHTSSASVRITEVLREDIAIGDDDDEDDYDLPDDPLMVQTRITDPEFQHRGLNKSGKVVAAPTKRRRKVIDDSSD